MQASCHSNRDSTHGALGLVERVVVWVAGVRGGTVCPSGWPPAHHPAPASVWCCDSPWMAARVLRVLLLLDGCCVPKTVYVCRTRELWWRQCLLARGYRPTL